MWATRLIASPPDPVAFELFGIAVRWYAIFILVGIVSGILLVQMLARRRQLDPQFPLDLAPTAVFAGVIGARLTYVLLKLDYFSLHPLQALNIRLGGLSIHGGLIAGAVAFWWWCHHTRQSFRVWSDLVVAGVALGQAIGRWGNWANQESFGRPTEGWWGLLIDPVHRPARFADATTFHPTFLYESAFNLGNAIVLSWIALNIPRRDWLRVGDGLAVYCFSYGVGRLVIERLRIDSLYIGPLPGAYWASAALMLLGLTLLVIAHLPAPSFARTTH